MPQLAERLGFDLPDALACDREALAHFFERVLAAVADPEAHLDDLLFARRERLQHGLGLLAEIQVDHRVRGRNDVSVLDEIAKMRVFLFADGRLERDGFLCDLQHLADFGHRDVHPDRDLLARRLASELLDEGARCPYQLVDRLDHVDRDADRTGLVGDRARDGLPNPPCRIGRALVAAGIFELVARLHEAGVALMDEVEELERAVPVLLRDGHYQAQVRPDRRLLRLFRRDLAADDSLEGAPEPL